MTGSSSRVTLTLQTAIAPIAWGTSYWIITELLPPERPLLAAAGRALPAGIALALITRRLPPPGWRLRLLALGVLNIGAFFVLLFIGAERLPGGVAATTGALGPLIVMLLGWPVLGIRPTTWGIACAVGGVIGVAMLVLGPEAALDPVGLLAATGGTVCFSSAIVLARRFGQPPIPLLAFTAWQLIIGGLIVVPLALAFEGVPPTPTDRNLLGFGVIGLIGTAAAYALWFRGIPRLPASAVAFLTLLSPCVATAIGWLALDQSLTAVQLLGAVVVGGSVIAGQRVSRPAPVRPEPPPGTQSGSLEPLSAFAARERMKRRSESRLRYTAVSGFSSTNVAVPMTASSARRAIVRATWS